MPSCFYIGSNVTVLPARLCVQSSKNLILPSVTKEWHLGFPLFTSPRESTEALMVGFSEVPVNL